MESNITSDHPQPTWPGDLNSHIGEREEPKAKL